MAGSGTFDCYIANLPLDFTEHNIREIFNVAGEIVGVKFLPPKLGAEGKVAFVKFTTESDAHCCAQFMNNHPLEDGARILKVRYKSKSEETNGVNGYSQQKSNRNDRSSGFNSGFNSGGGTKIEVMEQIFVSHVESPIEFWGQSCTEAFALQLEELTRKMEALCPTQTKVIGQLSTEKVYGCKFSEDDLWYRCIVEKALAKNEVHVRYIDYGNAEVADRFGLVTLPHSIESLPPLCQCYQVEGLELTNNDSQSDVFDKGLDELSDLINEQRIDLKVRKKEKHATIVKIHQNADGEVLDVPTTLMPTGAVRVKSGGQVSSFASALKTPAKSSETAWKTNNNNNYCSSNNFSSNSDSPIKNTFNCDSPVKNHFSHIPTDSPVKPFNSTKPTELPLKSDFNQIKTVGSPVKPAFNNVRPTESPVKSAFNQVKLTESPVKSAFNQVKPTESPVKSAFNQVKPTESPVKSALNQVKPTELSEKPASNHNTLSESSSRSTSNYIKPIDSPMKSGAYYGSCENPVEVIPNPVSYSESPAKLAATTGIHDPVKSAKSNVITKPNVVVIEKADSFTREYVPPATHKQKKSNEPVEDSINKESENFIEQIENSANIIEQLKKQLSEKTLLLESYTNQFPTAIAYENELVTESLPVGSIYIPAAENTKKGTNAAGKRTVKCRSVSPIEDEDVVIPKVSYTDVGGYSKEIAEIRSLVDLPLHHAELYKNIGIKLPRGVLLWGPQGTGKTLIARAIANESKVFIKEIFGPSIVCTSLENSNSILKSAFRKVEKNAPSILMIDQLDVIAPRGDCGANKMVAQLLSLLNQLKSNVIVISTAQRACNVDPTLKRAGLFDKEINIGKPDVNGRLEILRVLTKKMNISKGVCLNRISEESRGYTGCDLARLCSLAGMNGINTKIAASPDNISKDMLEALKRLTVKMSDFKYALEMSKPSICEAVCEVPTTTWKDISGMEDTKSQLKALTNYPTSKKMFDFGADSSLKGLLLYGRRGCGKTLFAKALANQRQYKFLCVKGYELSTVDIGDIFAKARKCAPCILYVRDIDLLTCENASLLKETLTEMSNIGEKENIYIIAATDRPEDVHPALRRNLHIVHIPLLDVTARMLILEGQMQKEGAKMDIDCKIEDIVEDTAGYTALDLHNLVHAACKTAGKPNENKSGDATHLTSQHFAEAMKCVRPSIGYSDMQRSQEFGGGATADECCKTYDVSGQQDDHGKKRKASRSGSQLKDITDGPRKAPQNNYVFVLGIFTIACFFYLLILYLYTSVRY